MGRSCSDLEIKGMTKPKNPFGVYQEANQASREKIITEFLVFLKSTRVRMKHVSDLADHVAREIGKCEGGNCARSTVLRNPRYKTLLLHFMAFEMDGHAKRSGRSEMNAEQARAALTGAELKASNLAQEVQRLRLYIAALESDAQTRAPQQLTDVHSLGRAEGRDVRGADYALTCKAILLILEHYRNVVRVDALRNAIVDPSMRRGDIVVDEKTAAPFLRWLRGNNKAAESAALSASDS